MKNPAKPPKPYPSDVSDEEWSFVVPYLTLIRLDSEQREHDLRAVFNALRWLVRTAAHWRMGISAHRDRPFRHRDRPFRSNVTAHFG